MFSFKQKSLFSVRVPILMRKCAFKAWKSDFSCCFSVREHLVKSQLFWKVFSLPKATFLYQMHILWKEKVHFLRRRICSWEKVHGVYAHSLWIRDWHKPRAIQCDFVYHCAIAEAKSRMLRGIDRSEISKSDRLIALRSKPFIVCVKRKQVF